MISTQDPHYISQSLCSIALQDPNFKAFNHRNAWSKEQLKSLVVSHGLDYLMFSKHELDNQLAEIIPDWNNMHDWSLYSLFIKRSQIKK